MRIQPVVCSLAAALAAAAALVVFGADVDAGEPGLPVARAQAAANAPAEAPVGGANLPAVETHSMPEPHVMRADETPATRAEAATANEPLATPIRCVLVVDAAGRPQPDVALGLHAADVRTGLMRTLPLGTTAVDGTLPFAAGRTGMLVAEAPGGRIGELHVGVDEPGPRLVLQPTGALAVLVTDAAGRPVIDAEVVLAGDGCRQTLRSDAFGRTTFPRVAAGPELELRTTAPGRRSVTTIAAGRAFGRTLEHAVVLALERAQVRTNLVDDAGRTLPNTTVRCTFLDGTSTRATSDAFGNLHIDLPPALAERPGTIRCERLDGRGRLLDGTVTITLPPAAGRVHLTPPIRLPDTDARTDAPNSAFEFATGRTRVSSRP